MSSASVTFTNANLVTCAATGSGIPPLIERSSLEVIDGKIARISEGVPSDHHDVKDLEGAFVMPGLWDGHIHLGSRVPPFEHLLRGEDSRVAMARCIAKAQDNLFHGVTSLRSLGEPDNTDLVLRDLIAAGTVEGPRIYAAGDTKWARRSAGPDLFRMRVRDAAFAGVDTVKLMMTGGIPYRGPVDALTTRKTELEAAIEEAHMWGRKVAVHAMGDLAVSMAIDAGADVIEHAFACTPAIAERFLREGLSWSPQLAVTDSWTPAYMKAQGMPEWMGKNAEDSRAGHHELFARAAQLGVKMVAGVDNLPRSSAGEVGIEMAAGIPGIVREIELMVELGLDKAEALRSATLNVAETVDAGSRSGSLETGKDADLLILGSNPLNDVRALLDVRQVWLAGRAVR